MTIFNISSDKADSINFYSNAILILGVVLTLLGAIVVIWSSSIRERFASERISANERAMAEAKKTAAIAAAATARLEKATEVARLETEKIRVELAWRTITSKQAEEMVKILSAHHDSITIAYISNDPETVNLATQLSKIFLRAGWGYSWQARTYYRESITDIFVPGTTDSQKLVRAAIEVTGLRFVLDPIPRSDASVGDGNASSPNMILIGSKASPF